MTKPVLIAADQARHVRLFGGDLYFTMPQAVANAGASLIEEVREPGEGPPLHVHRNEDEIFRIIAGRFRLRAGDQTLEAGPGDTLFLPRRVPHTFVNSGDDIGRILVVVQPGGFEQFFLDVLDKGLRVPDDMALIAELAAGYGLEILGPNPFTGR